MAQVLNNLIVSVGTSLVDAKPANAAIDVPRPLVSWVVPSGYKQARYSVIIQNVDAAAVPSGHAFTTSGPRSDGLNYFQVPYGLAIDVGFQGLCTATVSLSQNTSGDFEYVSLPCFFVFDREIERLVDANDLKVRWHKPLDPDNLPMSSGWEYRLQIASDPLFNNLVYDDASGMSMPAADPNVYITHDIGTEITTPNTNLGQFVAPTGYSNFSYDGSLQGPLYRLPRNVPFFYRVAAFDGMDWGLWSLVNAFYNDLTSPPTFKFISVTPTNNQYGDVLIVFQVGGQLPVTVELGFVGGPHVYQGDPIPPSLIESTVELPPGTWQVTWRSPRQLGYESAPITFYGLARDKYNVSNTDIYGPTTVDTTYLNDPRTNFGGLVWSMPVNGHISLINQGTVFETDMYPIQGHVSIGSGSESDMYPLVLGRYAWRNSYLLCPTETYESHASSQLGFGATDSFFDQRNFKGIAKIYWPEPMAQFNVQAGPTWSNAYRPTGEVQNVITVSERGFIFTAPVDNTNPTTIPTPIASRDLANNQYLRGYLDMSGVAQDYPNEYNWNTRPSWHIGREVYDSDDAWLQVTYWKLSSFHACATCNGRDYVPSSVAPFTRLPCPNANCVGGFDTTMPIIRSNGLSQGQPNYKSWIGSQVYNDIKWYRLSAFLQSDQKFGPRRYGLVAELPPYASGIQFTAGQQVSILDGVNFNVSDDQYDHFTVTDSNGNTRNFAGNMITLLNPDVVDPVTNDLLPNTNVAITMVKRQTPGFVSQGHLSQIVNSTFTEADVFPSEMGNIVSKTSFTSEEDPLQGHISIGSANWLLGGADPATSPLHAIRLIQPNEPGAIRVAGQFQRKWNTYDLGFRFLPAWWAEYQTIHIGQTGSDSNKFQVQYATLNNSSVGPWQDVVGDTATYDSVMQGWFISPLQFETFWDTSIKGAFPDQQMLLLRVRLYDPQQKTISEWKYSHPVQILHGITNPVNFISMTYDRFTKDVTIVFRLDDAQADTYDLTNFWYSLDNGNTWSSISSGDIHGPITNLSSGDGDQNIITHTITWSTAQYNFIPDDDVRINIECVPNRFRSGVTLPYFRWNTPTNPGIDEASSELAWLMGRMQTITFNTNTKTWTQLNPPVYNPGQLFYYYQELERIRRDPGQTPWPSGIYSFITFSPPNPLPSGSIPDISGAILPPQASGYNQWLSEFYTNGLTHGAAMSAVSTSAQLAVNVTIPADEAAITNGESAIRRNLINQGYFAEQYFQGALPSGIVESVEANVVSNTSGNALAGQLLRQWIFQVQNTAIAGDSLYAGGVYNPEGTVTELERVFFRVQIDGHTTFDSGGNGLPLRDFLYDFDGTRIGVAGFFGGKAVQNFVPNAGTTASQNQTGAWTGQATDTNPNPNSFSNPTAPTVATIGGTMKVAPADLPGQHATDVLPADFPNGWGGNYYWRVAAYNAFEAPNNAIPRPQIVGLSTAPGLALLTVEYLMLGNPNIQSTSIAPGTGIMVSNSFLPQPGWITPSQTTYVSDRRAQFQNYSSSSTRLWIPAGHDRPHPCMFWDTNKQMYMLFTTKLTFDGVTYRIINARGESVSSMCEYQNYFENDGNLATYRPTVVSALNQYFMYASVQPQSSSAFVGVSTSPDGETWSKFQQILFITNGIDPAVVYRNGVFYMWYEVNVSGVIKIAFATSTDGINFTMQNGGLSVYGEATNVTNPGVIYNNGFWVMYLNDAFNNIVSLISTDGINWSGRHTELSPTAAQPDDQSRPIVVVPKNPYPFFDLYQGNNELMLAFNYQPISGSVIGGSGIPASGASPSGSNYVYTTRLEDRIWLQSVSGNIVSQDDPFTAISSSRTGVSHAMTLNLAANGIAATDPIKVRIITGPAAPATIEYKRQSAWVTPTGLPDPTDYMDPSPLWPYNVALASIPYLTLPTV